MNYQRIIPPGPLRPFVKYFWTLETDSRDNSVKTFSAIPDGCPGIMMVQPGGQAFCMDESRTLPGMFLYGQTVVPARFSSAGKLGVIGVCFQSHALKSVFGFDAEELTSSCVDLDLIGNNRKRNLRELLVNAPSMNEQIKILSSYLIELQQAHNNHPDNVTSYAISQIDRSGGKITLKDLQRETQLSERSLERKFKKTIGISPRSYSRIVRFQDSMEQFRRDDFEKLSDVAYENDYFDQSHFIRVFKEFTGFSPLEFKRQSTELVDNFPQIK